MSVSCQLGNVLINLICDHAPISKAKDLGPSPSQVWEMSIHSLPLLKSNSVTRNMFL